MTEERVAKSEVAQPLRLERASELTAHGESLASHRDGRGAPPARRDDREYREYLSEEQRSRRGCIARRMQPDFHHGLLGVERWTHPDVERPHRRRRRLWSRLYVERSRELQSGERAFMGRIGLPELLI